MRVVFQQADLDTVLTGLVLGVSETDDFVVIRGEASAEDLADSAVLCIEAGGSGQVERRNYDHHGPGAPFESACVQALRRVAEPSDDLRRLVDYVASVDRGRLGAPPLVTEQVMTLSSVFSGMRLCTLDPKDQFCRGLSLLRETLRRGFNPAGPFPELPEWREYFERKRVEWIGIAAAKPGIRPFVTRGGLRAAFLETDYIGALGLLYEEGFEVGIAFSARYQPPSGGDAIPKYSIGRPGDARVDVLLPLFDALEPGWGGPSHGTIIGSPRGGSILTPDQVVQVVEQGL